MAQAIHFDPQVFAFLKETVSASIQRLDRFTDDGKVEPADGLSLPMSREAVIAGLPQLQPWLQERGYRASWSTPCHHSGDELVDEIAVLRSADDLEIVRLRQSQGGNYDVSHTQVLERLDAWRSISDFEIVGANGDWVALRFSRLPADLGAFVEEVYSFCPDTVEQGVGLKREAEFPADFAAARAILPQLSARMEQQLAAASTESEALMATMKLSLAAQALFQSGFIKESTPTDMGIRLLALELDRTRELFLWWD